MIATEIIQACDSCAPWIFIGVVLAFIVGFVFGITIWNVLMNAPEKDDPMG